MDLRQRLSALTKLTPSDRTETAGRPPLFPELGFALPAADRACQQPLAELARLADPCLLPGLRDYSWDQVAFIDTETTGLSTGVGTYVILLGVGVFSQGVFTVRQYFLPDPTFEHGFWQQVMTDLAAYPLLCTFNGRSYDLPLISNRLVMNGQPALPEQLHLDLLHPARRLWRKVLPSCALKSLEEHRLDWRRDGDVPGALIPGIYRDYLQSGDREALQPVFEHNRRDIISLFELAIHLACSYADPEASFARAEEFFGLAQSYLQAGQPQLAADLIVCGLSRPGDERQKRRALEQLAKLQARAGRYLEAVEAWRQLASMEQLSPAPYVEISKLYEHQLRDLAAARQAVQQAVNVGRRRSSLGVPLPQAVECDLLKRQLRLDQRLERAGRLVKKMGGDRFDR